MCGTFHFKWAWAQIKLCSKQSNNMWSIPTESFLYSTRCLYNIAHINWKYTVQKRIMVLNFKYENSFQIKQWLCSNRHAQHARFLLGRAVLVLVCVEMIQVVGVKAHRAQHRKRNKAKSLNRTKFGLIVFNECRCFPIHHNESCCAVNT